MSSSLDNDLFNDCKKDYANALFNLVCLINTETKVSNIVLGFIELLPPEYKPEDLMLRCTSIKFKEHKLLYSRLHISVLDALNIYKDSLSQDIIQNGNNPIYHGQLHQTTYLGCPYVSDHRSLPLIAPHWSSVRVLSAFPAELPGVYYLINFEKIADWLSERLHFDLVRRNSELIGSLHLILPNPVYRSLSLRLLPDEQRVRIQCEPRPCKEEEAKNLELCLREKRIYGYTSSNFEPLQTLTSYRNLSGPAEQIGFSVRSPRHGLLAVSDFAPFLRRVSVNFDVRQEVLNIQAKIGRQILRSQVNRSRTFDVLDLSIADDQPLTKLGERLRSAESIKKTEQEAANLGQFICDDIQASQAFVQYILQAARSRILIIDPYFDVISLVRFIFTLTRINVDVCLYSSAEVLKQPAQHLPPSQESQMLTNADVLYKILQSQKALFSYNFYVMPNSGNFHDRFIVIDDTVWLSGNSLNNIGSRLSVILKLPDSKSVLKKIESLLINDEDIMDFKDWYTPNNSISSNNSHESKLSLTV